MFAITKEDIFSLFWFLLLVIFLRTFVVEPFQIPSDSMNPTLLRGDHLLVSKSAYDLRLPFSGVSLASISSPARGDVIVFEYPNFEKSRAKEDVFYIKRIVGLPGDKIRIHGGILFINDLQIVSESFLVDMDTEKALPGFHKSSSMNLKSEVLTEKQPHWILYRPANLQTLSEEVATHASEFGTDCLQVGSYIIDHRLSGFRKMAENEICEFTVPSEKYFVMGDSRSDSEDGRFWGFVNHDQIRGKALIIFMALSGKPGASLASNKESDRKYFNWKRLGLAIR